MRWDSASKAYVQEVLGFLLSQGLAAEAQNRKNGQPAYAATEPKLGGIRGKPTAAESILTQHVTKRRTVKLCVICPLYVNVQAFQAKPGFASMLPRQCSEADVIVLDKMSDIDLVQNQHLAATLGARRNSISKKQLWHSASS